MGILDIFQSKPPVQPAAPAAPAAPAGNPHVEGNPTVPNATNTQHVLGPDGKPASSPNDGFKDLWNTAPNPQGNPTQQPLININQAELATRVKGMDFTQSLSPDLFQKVAAGGEEAVAAMKQMLNTVGQTVLAQSLTGNSMIAETAIKQHGNTLRGEIPSLIKQQSVRNTMQERNPALDNPAFAPFVQAAEQQILKKYPNATASELSEMTTQYFESLGSALNKPTADKQTQATKAADKETDWGQFLDMEPNIFGPN